MGDFQQFPPVDDKPMYTEVNAEASLLFRNIQNVSILEKLQRQVGNSPKELKFKQILQNCQEGSLTEKDWMHLSERFVVTTSDLNNIIWDQYHRVFYDNKSAFEYKMSRLQTLEIPIAKLQARHNCSEAKKNITKKQMDYIRVYTLQRDLI